MIRLSVVFALLLSASFGCASKPAAPSVMQVEALAIAPDERLGIDDMFETRVYMEPDLSGAYRVSADGTVDYPLIGRIRVIGLTSSELQEVITIRLKDGFLKNPQVTVTVNEWNSRKVSVFGQVMKPGPVPYFSNMTIIDAIAAAGDFSPTAAKNKVVLRREAKGSVVSRSYPVADIREGRAPNVTIFPGDVLVVEERLF